ncbi:unnamed protein product [Brassica rapa]|uniref:Neprosin PEP catalytic domain-containing protein n=1 Tax=Brassica campestris TaxID=3711 RepID=A0A8D9M147_BRACM|nr:unnamed protein product [Brassica rapa]
MNILLAESDTYYSGCYSLRYPGFLQTSSRIALKAAISHTSTYGGDQFAITIQIWKVRHPPLRRSYSGSLPSRPHGVVPSFPVSRVS